MTCPVSLSLSLYEHAKVLGSVCAFLMVRVSETNLQVSTA